MMQVRSIGVDEPALGAEFQYLNDRPALRYATMIFMDGQTDKASPL
jgi:hypothetical protein